MTQPLRIFICSTYADLSTERQAVLEAVRYFQQQHGAMEYFGARDERALEACLEEVRQSDVVVVIVGHKYGSVVPELGISYSQAEYEEGVRLGKRCLVYVLDGESNASEPPEAQAKLAAWRLS